MAGMKILYVIPFFPFPPLGGGYLRASNLIEQLSKRHELHLVCLALSGEEASSASRALGSKHAKSIRVVPHQPSRIGAFFRQSTRLLPYEIARNHNRKMTQTVRQAIEDLRPEAILCSRLASSQFLPPDPAPLTILDQHDLSRYLWTTFVEGNPHWWMRAYSRFNRALVKNYESRVYPRFDACISVSHAEREMTRGFAPADMRLLVASNGVDAGFYQPQPDVRVRERSLVITGTMNQQRNIEAAKIAALQILPALRSEFPDAELTIVGRSPAGSVRALTDEPGVTVTGKVDDVRPYLAAAEVVLAPYWFGSGVKHKIPIAMAMSKAIVGTHNAFQGIDAVDGTHALIGETAPDLIEKVATLFRDAELRRQLEREAFELAQAKYTWESIVDQLDRELFESATS